MVGVSDDDYVNKYSNAKTIRSDLPPKIEDDMARLVWLSLRLASLIVIEMAGSLLCTREVLLKAKYRDLFVERWSSSSSQELARNSLICVPLLCHLAHNIVCR